MAGAIKHMVRSHRNNREHKPFSDFERRAKGKKVRQEQKGILAKLFHRTSNK